MTKSMFEAIACNVRHSVVVAAAAAALLGGCAVNDTGASEVWDPIEVPIVSSSRSTVRSTSSPFVRSPSSIATGCRCRPRRASTCARESRRAGDHDQRSVQGDPSRAATTLARFLVNSTLGLAGLFDVATSFGLTKTKEGAGNTVGYYARRRARDDAASTRVSRRRSRRAMPGLSSRQYCRRLPWSW